MGLAGREALAGRVDGGAGEGAMTALAVRAGRDLSAGVAGAGAAGGAVLEGDREVGREALVADRADLRAGRGAGRRTRRARSRQRRGWHAGTPGRAVRVMGRGISAFRMAALADRVADRAAGGEAVPMAAGAVGMAAGGAGAGVAVGLRVRGRLRVGTR